MIKKYILKRLLIVFSFIVFFKNNTVFLNDIKLKTLFIHNKTPFIKNILFNYDLYYFSNKINNILTQYVLYLRNNPSKYVLLKLDTIALGNIKYNLFLNKSRMNVIVKYLILKGIQKNHIKYVICVKTKKNYNDSNTFNNNKLFVNIF